MKKYGIILVLACFLLLPGSGFCEDRFFEIKAKKFSYSPETIHVERGDVVKIRLISEDVHHGFYLDGYGIETTAYPGMDGNVKFLADKAGRFSFRCSVTCGEFHPYMVGFLVVEPNNRFLAYLLLTLGIGFVSSIFVFIRKKQE